MPHPWNLGPDWESYGPEYYNVTQSDPGWPNYVKTVEAYYHNSFGVSCFASWVYILSVLIPLRNFSFAILGIFAVIVIIASIIRIVCLFPSVNSFFRTSKVVGFCRRHIIDAPLLGHRHAEPINLIGKVITIKLPLRGEFLLLSGIFIVNLVPMVAFYSPFQPNNY